MENNQTNPYNTEPENTQYPDVPTQPTVAPEVQTPEAPAYGNPDATPTPEGAVYGDPYMPATPIPPKKSKKGLLIGLIAGGATLLVVIAALVLYFTGDSYKYGKAEDLLSEGKYDQAIVAFEELGSYKDSKDRIIECNRRILSEYLSENGDVSLTLEGYPIYLKKDGNKLLLGLKETYSSTLSFHISFGMTGDKGEFETTFSYRSATTTATGDCVLSEISTDNYLEIDNIEGSSLYSDSMSNLTNSASNFTCYCFQFLLDETDLGLTPADIGFTSIDQ